MVTQVQDPKINEALELLNNSAKEKKDEIQQLISERYTNIKDNLAIGTKSALQRYPWLFLGAIASAFIAAGFFAGYSYRRR